MCKSLDGFYFVLHPEYEKYLLRIDKQLHELTAFEIEKLHLYTQQF